MPGISAIKVRQKGARVGKGPNVQGHAADSVAP